jgi:hypothetical protein
MIGLDYALRNNVLCILFVISAAVGVVHWHPKGISLASGDRAKKLFLWT